MSPSERIFLDTSIMIARMVHSPETKVRIAERLNTYRHLCTSLVVRQEFKRRLLKEAEYLLNQLNHKRSLVKVLRHVNDVLPAQQGRKRNICLQVISTIFESADEEEQTERARRYLRTLLRAGLSDFDASVSQVLWSSGCACAKFSVTEKVPYRRYDFGPKDCKNTKGACGVQQFLGMQSKELRKFSVALDALADEQKTQELKETQSFIRTVLETLSEAEQLNPCLTVGDLLISLESADIASFYTMNGRESQFFCRILQQNLVVRPRNHQHEDVVCLNFEKHWPKF